MFAIGVTADPSVPSVPGKVSAKDRLAGPAPVIIWLNAVPAHGPLSRPGDRMGSTGGTLLILPANVLKGVLHVAGFLGSGPEGASRRGCLLRRPRDPKVGAALELSLLPALAAVRATSGPRAADHGDDGHPLLVNLETRMEPLGAFQHSGTGPPLPVLSVVAGVVGFPPALHLLWVQCGYGLPGSMAGYPNRLLVRRGADLHRPGEEGRAHRTQGAAGWTQRPDGRGRRCQELLVAGRRVHPGPPGPASASPSACGRRWKPKATPTCTSFTAACTPGTGQRCRRYGNWCCCQGAPATTCPSPARKRSDLNPDRSTCAAPRKNRPTSTAVPHRTHRLECRCHPTLLQSANEKANRDYPYKTRPLCRAGPARESAR